MSRPSYQERYGLGEEAISNTSPRPKKMGVVLAESIGASPTSSVTTAM
jgi:hypothetical protein